MDLMAVGRVRSSHGLSGEVKVLSFNGSADHFKGFTQIWLESSSGQKRAFEVERVKVQPEMTLVKLKGLDSPEAAKAWADTVIWVPRSEAMPLEEGEVYLSDLVGFQVVYEDRVLGEVRAYLEGGAHPLLEVRLTESGETRVLPFLDRYVGDLDLIRRRLPLRVDWILE